MAKSIRPKALKSSISKSNSSCSIFLPETESRTTPLTILMFLIGSATNKYNFSFLSFLRAFVLFPFKALKTSGKSVKVKITLSFKSGIFNGLEINLEKDETIFMK